MYTYIEYLSGVSYSGDWGREYLCTGLNVPVCIILLLWVGSPHYGIIINPFGPC